MLFVLSTFLIVLLVNFQKWILFQNRIGNYGTVQINRRRGDEERVEGRCWCFFARSSQSGEGGELGICPNSRPLKQSSPHDKADHYRS